MDAARNMVNKIVGFILKAIDFIAGKAAAMGATLKKMRPMSKREAIQQMNAAIGERDKAIRERDNAIWDRDMARAHRDATRDERDQARKKYYDANVAAARQAGRATQAEFDAIQQKQRADAAEKEAARLRQSDTMIASLTHKQGSAILAIYKDADKLISMCWKFMERPSTHEENPWNKEELRTTQYKGEDNERIPDRSNVDYGQFDHDCERTAQHIADLCKEAQLDKCIVIDVEDRVKLGDALMDKANTLREYKQKFEKIREQIEKTGFGKEKVKRINSITKNLNYVVSTITTIAASMQKSICVDLKAA